MFAHTVLRGQFVVRVLVDVVPPDGDVDAVEERAIPLYVPFISIDQPLEDLQEGVRERRGEGDLFQPFKQEVNDEAVLIEKGKKKSL